MSQEQEPIAADTGSEVDGVANVTGAAAEPALEREKAPPVESRFMFVDIAALRAKQLRRGALARVDSENVDADGEPVGRVRVYIPGGGLRFVFASDFGHSVDFIGHVTCKTSPRVRGSAVLLAPHALTDLSAQHKRRLGTILFPVVVNR